MHADVYILTYIHTYILQICDIQMGILDFWNDVLYAAAECAQSLGKLNKWIYG